ncbi:MAG: acetyltransferase [Erysipelotrichaceae bacterium]|nr:acetyltransferase [Erysipelotrichaceae bacterium]
MNKLVIIGASGHGKVIADIAKLNGYKDIIFLDDDITKKSNGKYQVVGTSDDIDKYADYDFFVGIGNNAIRKKIMNILKEKDANIPILIHPSAVIDETIYIAKGTVVMANAVINADAQIGEGCIINTSSTIDHDCIIEDYVHISPGSHLSGTVYVGAQTWIATGCSLINNINICSNVIIGAGSVVLNDITENGTYVGTPVRKVS